MKELKYFPAGTTLDIVMESLYNESKKSEEEYHAKFNGIDVFSTDSIDEAYVKVTGKNKKEFISDEAKLIKEWEEKDRKFKEKIPELTEYYTNIGKGLIDEKDMEYWKKIIPYRLNDIYRGFELECLIDFLNIMRNESITLEERLSSSKDKFMEQGHSGGSAYILFAMLVRFCPNGEDLVKYIQDKKYDK